MSSVAESDYEHWPSDDKLWSEKAAPAPGYDSNNGLHHHAYLPAAKPPSPEKSVAAPAPAPAAAQYHQPFYYAHGMPPKYHTYPPQGFPQQPFYYPAPDPRFYPFAAPAPAPVPAPQPAPQPVPTKTNVHVYKPTFSDSKSQPAMPQANAWHGRSKKEVEEDNMKIAKKEGAYEKRKIAPIGVSEEQLFWVMDDKGESELRFFRDIKEMNGTWNKDPRYEDTYYFLLEKEEEKK